MQTPLGVIPNSLEHDAFVRAYRDGDIIVHLDRLAAAHYLSAQLLLPLVSLPVLGLGVALALTGWIKTGLGIIAAGIIVPRLIKRGAPHFLLQQALQDPASYHKLIDSGVLNISTPESN